MLHKITPRSSYTRNIITLMAGTGLAQIIPIAVSPVLTRLYGPEEFGVFAFYMALVTILVVFVTGRYELAIFLPKKDRDAMHILVLAIFLSFLGSAVILAVLLFFYFLVDDFIDISVLKEGGYWIPASTLLLGIYQSLSCWANRNSQYKNIAVSRTAQGTSIASMQLLGGSFGFKSFGLIGGQLIGQFLSALLLATLILRHGKDKLFKISIKHICVLAKKYVNFPKFLIVAHGFNNASMQMPIMLLGGGFGVSNAGYYVLTQRVMSAPLVLIAAAIGDVFRQEASYAYVHNGDCRDIYKKTLKRLLILSALPFFVFFFIAPDLFAWVFGEQWRQSGEYAQIITPMCFLQFLISPLSTMFMIAEKQRLDLLWQISLFVLTATSFFAGLFFENDRLALILFSFSYCVMYIVCGFMAYGFSVKSAD